MLIFCIGKIIKRDNCPFTDDPTFYLWPTYRNFSTCACWRVQLLPWKSLIFGNHTLWNIPYAKQRCLSSVLNNLWSAFMHCLYKALEPTTFPGLDLYMETHYLIWTQQQSSTYGWILIYSLSPCFQMGESQSPKGQFRELLHTQLV